MQRPGEYERPATVLVDEPLEVAEQSRDPLYLVENHARVPLQTTEEAARVFERLLPVLEVLQVDVPELGKRCAGKGGLA